MYRKLDKIKELLNVNEVLIENQPSLKNPAMKTISCFLYSYFIARGIADKTDDNPIKKVRFISPSNKLKMDEKTKHNILNKIDSSSKIYRLIIKVIAKFLKIESDQILTYLVDIDKAIDLVRLIINIFIDKKLATTIVNNSTIFEKIKLTKNQILNISKVIQKTDKKYTLTKMLAIIYTEVLLHDKPEWLEHMKKYKKQDDLCDALLQGLFILF